MKKRYCISKIFIFIALIFFIFLKGTVSAENLKNYKKYNFKWGNINRKYFLYVPSNLDKKKPAPLLIVLHGGGGTARGMVRLTKKRFNRLADRDGFIAAYPDGIDKHWNDGREVLGYNTQRKNVDDLGFISRMIDRVSKDYNIDKKRIYATGMSNGGLMSYRLAMELSGKIAAIAPVTASLGEKLNKKSSPQKPVSVLILNGTHDPLMPYNGGNIGFKRQKRDIGKVISTRETVKVWVEHNGCKKDPKIIQLPDINKKDGCTVEKEVFSGGKNGAEVVLYTVHKGGHTWPQGTQYLPVGIIGRTNMDINACDVIWEFFKRHKR